MIFNLKLEDRLNKFKSLKLTGVTILALELLFGADSLTPKLNHLRTLQFGTVGKAIADLLDKRQYRLIPKFENHDLKHIVLEYEMTMQDEIRMQAYLVGNGNLTLPCLTFLSLGLFYPRIWKDLPKHFRQGQASNSIYYLTLEQCLDKDLIEVRNLYGRKK
ncbi:hypothetical protein WG954_15960 [Lacibacter sp. H375]|uniref:hypothetical protein n=1 Tax=Lacibacter sp. H375 TaxID=3133424 RepID=UPI0030C3BCF5